MLTQELAVPGGPAERAASPLVVTGRLLLFMAWVSGTALMIPLLTGGALALDEHGSYWIVDSELPGTSLQRSLQYAAIPPLSGWLQAVSLSVFGLSEWAFRLPSAVAYLGAVGMMYVLGNRVADPMVGGVAALLVAWHPEALDEVRIARCYGLVLFLSTVVVWTTLVWRQEPRSWKSLLWVPPAAALLWTHYVSVLLVGAAGAAVLAGVLRSRGRHRGRALGIWLCGMLGLSLLACPLIPSVLRLQAWGPYLNFMSDDQTLFSLIGPLWWLGLPLGWLVSRVHWKRRALPGANPPSAHAWSVLIWCSIVPLILLAVLAAGDFSSLANPRYRVAFVPGGACLLALVIRSRTSRAATLAATLAVLVSVWLTVPRGPFQPGRLHDPADQQWRELSHDMQQLSRPGEPVFVQSGLVEAGILPAFLEDRQFQEYVACRLSRFYVPEPHPRYALPLVWKGPVDVPAFYRSLISELPMPDAVFWIAAATDTDLNRFSLARMQQVTRDAGFVLTWNRDWERATLQQYTRVVREPR